VRNAVEENQPLPSPSFVVNALGAVFPVKPVIGGSGWQNAQIKRAVSKLHWLALVEFFI
jgi:hypothetical protein